MGYRQELNVLYGDVREGDYIPDTTGQNWLVQGIQQRDGRVWLFLYRTPNMEYTIVGDYDNHILVKRIPEYALGRNQDRGQDRHTPARPSRRTRSLHSRGTKYLRPS